jgi:hypothetical protein
VTRSALRLAIVALVVALVAGLVGVGTAGATGPTCERQSEHNSGIALTSPRERPVIMVHGWNGSSGALTEIERALTAAGAATAGRVAPLYFDYRAAATHWASVPEIAACLAAYVREASNQYRRLTGGSDGRVVVVAHSMGGLAIRFATDPGYADTPITPDQLGGVVTLGTPALGSPFGGLGPASQVNRLVALLNSNDRLGVFESRDQGTDGGTCLSSHAGPSHAMPDGCSGAPFLAAPWQVRQVAGDVSVDRSLFGVHLYDIPLASDGVVPLSSAHGYPVSAVGEVPQPAHVEAVRVTCRVGFDAVYSAAAAALAGIGGGAAGAGLRKPQLAWLAARSATELVNDFGTFGDLANDEMGLGLAAFLGYATQMASCGHAGLTRDPESLAAMVRSVDGTLAALGPVAAADRPATISLEGFGPFRWGDAREDAEAAMGVQFVISPHGYDDCHDAQLPGRPTPVFGIRGGRVAAADVGGESVVSDTGIRVGDPVAAVLAAYPGISASAVPHWPGSTNYEHTSGGRTASFVSYDHLTVGYMRFGITGSFGEATPCA